MSDNQTPLLFSKLRGQRVVVVGGGSGIGKAIAKICAQLGADVCISSRDAAKLERTATELGSSVSFDPVDITQEDDVRAWAARQPPSHHLVISASKAQHGPFAEFDTAKLHAMMNSKFVGPFVVARELLPRLVAGGSITFFSGVLSRRPGANCAALGAVNGAVEALARGLALELGPELRVNCMSPGMVRSDAYAGMPEEARQAMYDNTGASLPVGRVGETSEVAEVVVHLMTNAYTTGVVLDTDGGHMIRQYATR